MKGGGLENIHDKLRYNQGTISNGKNKNVTIFTDKNGKAQFVQKGPFHKKADLASAKAQYDKLCEIGVGLPIKV